MHLLDLLSMLFSSITCTQHHLHASPTVVALVDVSDSCTDSNPLLPTVQTPVKDSAHGQSSFFFLFQIDLKSKYKVFFNPRNLLLIKALQFVDVLQHIDQYFIWTCRFDWSPSYVPAISIESHISNESWPAHKQTHKSIVDVNRLPTRTKTVSLTTTYTNTVALSELLTVKLSEAAVGIMTDKKRFVTRADVACPRASAGLHTVHSPLCNIANIALNNTDMLSLLSPPSLKKERLHPRPAAPAASLHQHGRWSTARRRCPPVGSIRGAGARWHPRGQWLLLVCIQDLPDWGRPHDHSHLLRKGEWLQWGANWCSCYNCRYDVFHLIWFTFHHIGCVWD